MKEAHLDPARSIVEKFGAAQVAEITGKSLTRVYRWMYPKDRGGTGGLIPYSDAQALLRYATEQRIDISAQDFFPKAAAEAAE